MLVRKRFSNGNTYGEGFLNVDWDAQLFIRFGESWDSAPSTWKRETFEWCIPEEFYDWLPEQ